jgi:RNA polymerase sigma-70 factor (ECF subfamily)
MEGWGVREEMEAEAAVRLAAFDQYRGLLFSVAYRMLGSVADAEDMLQETFLRWQQAADEEIRSPRAFLVTIISRLSINHLQSALTPMERAVFLLREVFEYEYGEIAAALDQSEVNCRQILRRARQHVNAMRPRFKASRRKRTDLLQRFLQATESGDMDGLLSLLANDVVLYADGGGKGIAVPNPVHGADKVARGVLGSLKKLAPRNLVRRTVEVNGRPGAVAYEDGKPFSVVTFEAGDDGIREIYVVTNPEKLSRLPGLSLDVN